MKKRRLFNFLPGLSVLLFLSVIIPSSVHAKWKALADISTPGQGRWGAMSVAINNKVYVGGGYLGNNQNVNDWQEYNPATDKWTVKNSMPGTASNRSGGVTFTINGKGYLGLGIENFNSFVTPWNFLTDLWEYDPSNDTWTKKADFPGMGRGFCGVFVANDKAYIVGGNTGKLTADATNELYEYDPATNKWTAKTSYPDAYIKNQPFAFGMNGKGYVSGGQLSGGRTDKTYEYDPATDKWTAKKAFPGGEVNAGVSFVAGGKAFCGLGGKNGSMYPIEFYTYDPSSDDWSYVGGMQFGGQPRMFTTSSVINNKVYMGAGWRIDGSSQTWFRDWYEVDAVTALNTNNVTNSNTDISVYPNPATGKLYIRCNNQCNAYTLYSITGNKVRSGYVTHGKAEVNTSGLPSGQYIMQLSGQDNLKHTTIIINN